MTQALEVLAKAPKTIQMDTLSDVLRVIRLSGGMFLRLRLSAPYSISAMKNEDVRTMFAGGADHVLPFHLVTQGPIWFEVEGEKPVQLNSGDIIVIPHGTAHAVSDEPGKRPLEVSEVQDGIAGFPMTLTWGGQGPESKVLCGFFTCAGRLFNPLMESLPQMIVVRNTAERTPWLAGTIERTFDETLKSRPGGAALVERLTSLLFMEVVQRHLEDNVASGWLAGLSDPVVSKVLQLMHEQPARAWTVEELAKNAGASRSVVADRFAETVGTTPIKYLSGWRLELAAARLIESNDSIAEIASGVGYESETSFSRAFARHLGQAPAGWRSSKKRSQPTLAPAPS